MNNEWIPVSKRLPDKDGRYFVTRIVDGDLMSCICRFDSTENNFYLFDIVTDEIVAWMPLPAPYVDPIKEVKVTLNVPNYISNERILNYLLCRLDDNDIIKSIKLEE